MNEMEVAQAEISTDEPSDELTDADVEGGGVTIGTLCLFVAGAYCFFTGIPNHGGHINNFDEAVLGVVMCVIAVLIAMAMYFHDTTR